MSKDNIDDLLQARLALIQQLALVELKMLKKLNPPALLSKEILGRQVQLQVMHISDEVSAGIYYLLTAPRVK